MAMTVTATMSGTAANQHIYLWIRVLTGAIEAGGASVTGLNATGGTTISASLTPNGSNSLPCFATTGDNNVGTYSALANNTLDSSTSDVDTWQACFGRYTGAVTAATPLTFGVNVGVGGSDYTTWACYEVRASGGTTPAVDGSSPILASAVTAGAKTVTSASFTPPAGSVIVAMICCGGPGSSGSMVMTVTDTGGGLTWTQRAGSPTIADQDSFVFTATVPGGGGGGAPSPVTLRQQRRRYQVRQGRHAWQQTVSPPAYIPPVPQTYDVNGISSTVSSASGSVTIPTSTKVISQILGSGSGSYFADQNGNPRMWLGDEIWAMLTNSGRWNSGNYQAALDSYFATRASQGFTICYTDMFNSTFIGGATNGQMWNGQTPFVSNNPSSGLNNTYWQVIDYALTSAFNNNITLALSFGGHWDWDTSGNAMFGFTSTQYQAAGNAIGARYKNQANLIWTIMDDYFSSFDSSLSSLLTGLRASGDTHPIAIENFSESSSRYIFLQNETGCGTTNGSATVTDSNCTSQYVGAAVTGSGIPANSVIVSVNPNVSFVMNNQATATATVTLSITSVQAAWGIANAQYNFGYSYACTYLCIEFMYAESSPIAGIYGDGYFYQGASTYDVTYDRAIRQDAWWAVTSGARGWDIGDEALWQWPSSAPAAVATQWFGANNTKNIREFMESLTGWHTLTPALGSTLITAGRGTRAAQIVSGGGGTQYEPAFTNNYVSAARSPDTGSGSSLAIVYMPLATTITIDQTKLAAGYTAKWVDPVTCATSTATVGSTYNSTAKGNNSRGAPDWVLVFQGPSGTTYSVAGSSAASSSASGTLSLNAMVSGSATSTSAASGAIVQTMSVSGSSSASSAGNGTLGLVGAVSGSSAASSSANGAIVQTMALSGSSPNASSANGTLSLNAVLAGSSISSSSASGTVTATLVTSGSSAASSSASGAIGQLVAISGTSTTVSSSSGAVSIVRVLELDGSSSTVSSASGAITAAAVISGSSSTASTAAGSVVLIGVVAGSSSTLSTASGAVSRFSPLAGQSATTSQANGAVVQIGVISGTSATATTASGFLGTLSPISGSATAVSAASGAVVAQLAVAGSSASVSGANAVLSLTGAVAGTSSTATSAAGTITAVQVVTGLSATASSASGSLTRLTPIAGSSTSTSSASGAVTIATGAQTYPVTGTSSTQSAANGTVSLFAALAGTSVSASAATGAVTMNGVLAGSAASVSGATGSISLTGAVSGSATSVSAAASSIMLTGVVAGSSATSSSGAGWLAGGPISGSSSTQSSATGALGLKAAISGTSTTQSQGSGGLTIVGLPPLIISALSATVSTASGAVATVMALTGSASTASSASGTIGARGALTGFSSAVSAGLGGIVLVMRVSGSSVTVSKADGYLADINRLTGLSVTLSRGYGWIGLPFQAGALPDEVTAIVWVSNVLGASVSVDTVNATIETNEISAEVT